MISHKSIVYFRLFAGSLLVLCLSVLISCEREVDLRPDGKGNIVVECILTEGETQTLRLSSTDIVSASLKDAVISLTDETESTLAGRFVFQEGDQWKMDYAAKPYHKYLLTVEVDGFETVIAHTVMPERVGIQHTVLWRVWPENLEFDGFPDWELGSRYEIKSLPQGAVWVCGMNYDESSGKHVLASTIATSLESSDLFNLTGETYWNEYNPQADQRFEDLYEKKGPEDVSMVGSGNWIYHFPREFRPTMYKYVVGCPLHDTFLRIPPITEDDNRTAADPKGYFSIAGSFQGSTFGIEPSSLTDGYILFISVSEEYDRYLKELLTEESRHASMQDFASLFSRENIHGNIENGIGIFGAKTEQELPWIKHNKSGSWGNDFEW